MIHTEKTKGKKNQIGTNPQASKIVAGNKLKRKRLEQAANPQAMQVQVIHLGQKREYS